MIFVALHARLWAQIASAGLASPSDWAAFKESSERATYPGKAAIAKESHPWIAHVERAAASEDHAQLAGEAAVEGFEAEAKARHARAAHPHAHVYPESAAAHAAAASLEVDEGGSDDGPRLLVGEELAAHIAALKLEHIN